MRTLNGKQSHAEMLAQDKILECRLLLDKGSYSAISLVPRMATDKILPVAHWITLAIKKRCTSLTADNKTMLSPPTVETMSTGGDQASGLFVHAHTSTYLQARPVPYGVRGSTLQRWGPDMNPW